MAIDISADPTVGRIVTDSKKRVSKAKKGGDKWAMMAPAVIAFDESLRKMAANRAKTFWESKEAELSKMQSYFNTGLQFQIDHIEEYGAGPGWKDKMRLEHRKAFIDDKLTGGANISEKARQDLIRISEEDIENDIQEYGRMLNLSMEFRLRGDETKESKKAGFFKSYDDAMTKQLRNIIESGGLLPSTTNWLSSRNKGSKSDDDISAEMAIMKEFQENVFGSSVKWDEASQDYKTAVEDNRIHNMFAAKEEDYQLSSVLSKYKNTFFLGLASNDKEKGYVHGDGAFTVEFQVDDTENKGKKKSVILTASKVNSLMDATERMNFWRQVTTIASAERYKYEQTKAKEGLLEDDHFINIGIKKVQDTGNLKAIDLNKGFLDMFKGTKGIVFDPLSPAEMRELTLGEIEGPRGLIDMSSSERVRFDKAQVVVNQAASRITDLEGYNQAVEGVDTSRTSDIYTFLSARNEEGFINNLNIADIKEIENYIELQPDSNIKRAAWILLDARKNEIPLEAQIQNDQQAITEASDSTSYMDYIDSPSKKKEPEEVKKIYDSVEEVLADQRSVDPIGALKNIARVIRQSLKERLPEVPSAAPYSQENIEKITDAPALVYIKENIPIVKKAAEDFVEAAPARLKKAATTVSKEANEVFNKVAELDNYISTGDFAQDVGIQSDRITAELITLSQNAVEKVQDFYADTENIRKDIKDQAKLMTFYDEFTEDNWNYVKRDIVDTYKQFARNNNIDITKFIQKAGARWLFEMYKDMQVLVDTTTGSIKNTSLLARREDSEED